jgi:small subunit ribosomal protein S6
VNTTSRSYEALYIVDPALNDEQVEAIIAKYSTAVTDQAGEVKAVGKWDKRRLAYEIMGRREGIYILMFFDGESAVAKELDRVLRIADDVMRHIITRVEPQHVDTTRIDRPQPTAETAAEQAPAEEQAPVEPAAATEEAAQEPEGAAPEEPSAEAAAEAPVAEEEPAAEEAAEPAEAPEAPVEEPPAEEAIEAPAEEATAEEPAEEPELEAAPEKAGEEPAEDASEEPEPQESTEETQGEEPKAE